MSKMTAFRFSGNLEHRLGAQWMVDLCQSDLNTDYEKNSTQLMAAQVPARWSMQHLLALVAIAWTMTQGIKTNRTAYRLGHQSKSHRQRQRAVEQTHVQMGRK